MDQVTLEAVEAGVERLLKAYSTLKSENATLREQLAIMESKQRIFKTRLDTMLSRLDGVVPQ